ncbi:pentapeptide repeat-containing protein [Planosporangium thailandense]|nr:pentapeptide repeat-containing protein [Planosporangium thailandense]
MRATAVRVRTGRAGTGGARDLRAAVERVPLRLRVAYFVGVALLLAFLASRGAVNRGGGAADEHGRTCPGGANFAGQTVAGVDLSQQQLLCLNLERSTLTGNVSDSNLARANLYAAHLRNLWLNDVDLSVSDLRRADAAGLNMTGGRLAHADLRGAGLKGARFEDVGLQQAQLSGANLPSVGFTRSDLSGVDARGTDFTGASFYDSNLRGARLAGAKLDRTIWSNAVCPDGTKSSRNDPESCDGHLTAAR